MPTIEDRLRDAGQVWREQADSVAGEAIPTSRVAGRRRRTRRTALATAAAVACLGVGIPVAGVLVHRAAEHGTGRGGVAASCAGPQLRLGEQPHSGSVPARRGQSLIVTGRFYLDSCNDTNPQLHPAPRPIAVALTLRHGSHVVRLGTVQAHGVLGTFRTTVRIPSGFPAGPATLTTRASGHQPSDTDQTPVEPVRLTIVK
ncbi:hypothetical protein GCM10027572_22240 [Flexivirga lutea]